MVCRNCKKCECWKLVEKDIDDEIRKIKEDTKRFGLNEKTMWIYVNTYEKAKEIMFGGKDGNRRID